jgi:hypothetical protein
MPTCLSRKNHRFLLLPRAKKLGNFSVLGHAAGTKEEF